MYKLIPHKYCPLSELYSEEDDRDGSSSNDHLCFPVVRTTHIERQEKEEKVFSSSSSSSSLGGGGDCDWDKCNKRRFGSTSTHPCSVWSLDYVDVNLTAMNLEKIFYGNGVVMIRSRNTAPATMDCISTFLTFVAWLVRLLRGHSCIERLDLSSSDLVLVGTSPAVNPHNWDYASKQCEVANEQIASAVFSMHRLTHLRMQAFEFVYHSESYAPCLWQNLSVLDYYSFTGTATIPLVRVRDCVRFVDCQCVHLARLSNSPVATLVLDKVLLSDKLCSDLDTCINLRYLAIGSWIGSNAVGPRLPPPLSRESMCLWVGLCERLTELRVLNMNQLTDVALLNSNVTVLNCRNQLSVGGGEPPQQPKKKKSRSENNNKNNNREEKEQDDREESVLFYWIKRSFGATTNACLVRIHCKKNYDKIGEPLGAAGVSRDFIRAIDDMRKTGSLPLAHVSKLTIRPGHGPLKNGAPVTKSQFRIKGRDDRTVTLDVDFEKLNGDGDAECKVFYDDVVKECGKLEEICMQIPISVCTGNDMAPHFEILATHPTLRTVNIEAPVLCGLALRELLTCLTVAQNGVVAVNCNMYISSQFFADRLAEMLHTNTTIEFLKGVVFRKSHFAVAVSGALISRQPPLKEFSYTVRNRGSWGNEYQALCTLNKIINRTIPQSP